MSVNDKAAMLNKIYPCHKIGVAGQSVNMYLKSETNLFHHISETNSKHFHALPPTHQMPTP